MKTSKDILHECNLLIDHNDSGQTNIPLILEKLSELTQSEKVIISLKPRIRELTKSTKFRYQYTKKENSLQIDDFKPEIYKELKVILKSNPIIKDHTPIDQTSKLKQWAKENEVKNYTFLPIKKKSGLYGIIGFINLKIVNLQENETNDFYNFCNDLGEIIKKIEKKESKELKRGFPKTILTNFIDPIIILNKNLQPTYISPSYYQLTKQNENSIENINDIDILNFDLSQIGSWKFPKKIISEINCLNNKDKIIFEHQINSIAGKQNKVKYYLITSRDVTDREHLIHKMKLNLKKEKDLSTMKTKFISMTSHELRTPLSTILSSVDILELLIDKSEEMDLKDKILTHLRKIQIQINRLNRIISDIFIIDRSVDSKLNNEKIDINSITKQIIINYFSQDDLNKIDLKFEEEKVLINTDKDALINILRNLIENSLKYGQNLSKKIIIETKIDLEYNQFSIEDFGIGIPKIDQPHIFESFYRSGNVNNIKGTGLGLSIVRDLLMKLKGILEFESQEGKGTKFTIKFKNEKDNPTN